MSSSRTVLVIAPDHGLRRSIEFALEVEGFAVFSFEQLTPALASPHVADGICIVIDEEALLSDPFAMAAVKQITQPALLLVDRSRTMPEVLSIKILRKPILGNALIRAVRSTDGNLR